MSACVEGGMIWVGGNAFGIKRYKDLYRGFWGQIWG